MRSQQQGEFPSRKKMQLSALSEKSEATQLKAPPGLSTPETRAAKDRNGAPHYEYVNTSSKAVCSF